MRVLVLELDNLAFDFDGVALDVVLPKRVVTLRRSAEHGDGNPTSNHVRTRVSIYLVSFTRARRSPLVIGRSGLGACTMTCLSKSSCSRSMFCTSVAIDGLTG